MKIVKTLLLSSLLATAAFNAQALSPQEQLEQAGTAIEQGNYQKAYELLLPLAEQGDMIAQTVLGILYKEGKGVKQDDYQAFKWVEKAAEQGLADAQFDLGVMYRDGKGVKQDDYQSFKWTKKAADQGYAKAQGMLGSMYYLGKGVRHDSTTGKKWIGLACDNGLQVACDTYRELNEGKLR